MGNYVKSNSPENLKNFILPDGRTLYDVFYNENGSTKIDNLGAADYVNDYGGVTPGVKTYEYSNTEGYTSVSANSADTTTRYQIRLATTNPENGSINTMSVTFDPSKSDSLNRTLINFPGSGGWNAAGVTGYQAGSFETYCLENDDGYMTININGCGANKNLCDTAYNASQLIQQNYGNVSADHRYVITGASAGAASTVEMADAIIRGRGNSDHSPIDFMLLDGADAYEGACQGFVNKINNNPTVRNELINTGSIIYAYESQDPNIGGRDGNIRAIDNLGNLAEQGMIVVEKDPRNGGYPLHSGNNSNELMLSNGESQKIVNESFDPNNESNRYNLILPTKGSDGHYQTKEITERQLSAYSEFRKTTGNSGQIKYFNRLSENDLDTITPVEPRRSTEEKTTEKDTNTTTKTEDKKESSTEEKTTQPTSSKDSTTMIEYNAVVDGANNIINSINGTTFRDNTNLNYHFCQDTTADFPESLNQANAFLFATSGNLLNNISNDIKNIGNILESYSLIDQELANEAGLLNGGPSGDNKAADTSLDSALYIDTDSLAANLFPGDLKQGEVGKISASDISSMMNGSELTGIIGNGLHSEYQDAKNLKESIEGLINNPNITSPEWKLMKERLNQYSDCCDARMKATEVLENAYLESLKKVQDYMAPDEYLDDGEIGAYEADLATATARVEQLEAENETLSAIELVEETVTDPETGESYTISNAAEYYAAQQQITANTLEIESLNVDIAEYNRMLDKLYGWANVLNEANQIVDDAVGQVNQLYGNEVNAMNPVNVTPYKSTGDSFNGSPGANLSAPAAGGATGGSSGGGAGGSSGGGSNPLPSKPGNTAQSGNEAKPTTNNYYAKDKNQIKNPQNNGNGNNSNPQNNQIYNIDEQLNKIKPEKLRYLRADKSLLDFELENNEIKSLQYTYSFNSEAEANAMLPKYQAKYSGSPWVKQVQTDGNNIEVILKESAYQGKNVESVINQSFINE